MSAKVLKISATAVLRTIFGPAMEKLEPSILNSNLLPVNAIGEVLFLSVVSFGKCGRAVTPISTSFLAFPL